MTKLSKRKTIRRVLSSALASTLTFTSLGLGNFSWADDTTSEEVVVTESEPASEDPSIIISTNVGEDEETSSEESSELKSEEELSEEKNPEDSSEEKSSEELEKEDTKKSNIEVTFDEGVTVTVKNDDTTVIISKNDDNVYILDKDNNSFTHPYDDKFIIDDFDIDEDIDISFAANDNYVLTGYSISNDDETIIEESEVEKLEYNTQLTATDNVYININTDIAEGNVDVSTLDDNQKYIYDNINLDYINKVTRFLPADMILLKQTVADKHKLSGESFEGLFTSNEDQIAEAFLYQSDDVVGLYDLNKKSDYLVGLADTLKDDDDFSIIDYTFAKSNTDAELLDGAFFDTETGLFYIPKSLIDYLEDGTVNIGSKQLQILYAFDDGTDNIEVQEIEDEKGKITEVEADMAAPKVFMRMAAPRLLGASAADVTTVGKITGNVQVGDTATFKMNYGYSAENIGYGKGVIYNPNMLADPSGSLNFFLTALYGDPNFNINSLESNLCACFPHRLIFNEPTTYNFDTGATMTINPGVYALECIHTNQRFGANHAPKSPNNITARILAVDINGDSGYVYVGLTCPETYTQSGAGVIKLQYQKNVPETPQEKYGGFSLIKKDDKGNTLAAGFKFAVYDMNDRYVATITTDSAGIAKLSNVAIPLGQDSVRFKVHEISVPNERYALDPNTYEINATEGGENQIELTVVDTLLPQVTVRKVDTDGNWLKQRAYCQILDADENVVIGAFECGYNEVTKSLPDFGTYILREWEEPEGYLHANDVTFTVTEENTTVPLTVIMEDPLTVTTFAKLRENPDGTVGSPLPGAHLYLYRKIAEGYYEPVANWISGDSDHVIKALPAGWYRLEEHEAPEGYIRSQPMEFEVKLTTDLQTVTMIDPETKLSILKVDEKGNPLVGATLSLYKTTSTTNNGKIEYSKGDFIETWVTDGTPHFLYGLPTDQVYWLEEDEAPPQYTNFGHQLIQFGHQHTDECYANETTPWPLVYASYAEASPGHSARHLICAACGEVLKHENNWFDNNGVEHWDLDYDYLAFQTELIEFDRLGIYYVNDDHTSFVRNNPDADHQNKVSDFFSENNVIRVYKDNSLKKADGTWITAGIDAGENAGKDPNYKYLTWSVPIASIGGFSGFYFPTSQTADYETVTVGPGAHEQWIGTNSRSLRGFHLHCQGAYADKASWDPADHGTSNGGELICGFAEADNLDNFVIRVHDTKIIDGYGFQIAKVNDRGIFIPGAKLSVYKVNDADETLIRSFTSATTPELFFDVAPGNYKLVEDEPPAGYTSAEPVEFTVDSTNQLVTVTLTDPLTKIFVSKKLVSDGNAVDVPGAELIIVDTDDNIVDRWISNGGLHEVTGKLSVNTEYILREVDEISGTMNAGDFKFKLDDTGKVVPISYNSRAYALSSDGKTITCYNRENVVSFIKQDENGNPLKGATLRLIRKDNSRVVDTWVSGDDGETNGKINPHVIKGLAEGTYIFREIQAPPGFFDAVQNVDQEIEITDQSETFTFTKTNIANKAEFIKIDAKTKEPLAGATLALWKLDSNGNPSNFIEEWVTDGTPHSIIGIPTGDYVLFELQAPEGYDYANSLIKDNQQINSLRFTITNSEETQTITVEDPRVRGEFELLKVDSVTGKPITDDTAEFEFLEYNVTTGDYEVSQHYWIEYVEDGLYSVVNNLTDVPDHYLEWTPQNKGKFAYRETKAPSGAIVDPNMQYIDLLIEDLDESVVMSNDTTHECSLHPEREWTIDGHKIFLGHNAEPTGGFDTPYVIFNDTTLAVKYKGKVFANATYKGGFELVKWDNDAIASSKANTAQGDVPDLSGFEFKLYNISGKAVYVYPKGDASEKVKVENDGLVAVYTYDSAGNISTAVHNELITDDDGYVGIPHGSLQAGTYKIVETKTPDGYKLPDKDSKSITFTITENDEYFHFEYGNLTNESDIKSDTKYFADDIIKGDVQLVKYDKELNKSEALSGKLEGVEFEIITKSENPVYVDGEWYNKNDVVATITTHWNTDKNAYTAETTGKLLPYGSYTIREKTAGEGYIKTDAIQNFTIREDGELVTLNTAGELLKFSNQVIRGDVKFVKLEEGVNRQIKAPFLITNLDTGEKHIVVTNAEGNFSSATTDEIKHSTNTNGYDALLETYATNPDYAPKANELDDPAGVWFGIGENETVSPVDDTLCALPYGNYKLEELRCHSNLGLDLVTVNFTVDETVTSIDNKSVDLDVIYNFPTGNPKLTSSAIDSASKTHAAKADKVVTITDRVTVSNLVSENEYKVVGYLIDKKTNEKIKYNNVEVTDEYTFVADGTKEICDLSFTFDASTYAGNSVVVYLYLYKAGRIVANEITDQGANINNISETVYFPVIRTSLEDELTKDNVLTAETIATSKVIDTVSYENLALNTANDTAETIADIAENQTYTIKGKLYDKATGEVVATNEITFTPTTPSSTVEVPYEFAGVNGHTYVATEELYANNVLIAEHNNLEDELQTVYSPSGRTEAIDTTTNSQTGVVGKNQVIKDTVYYENLVIGKTYTVKGTLMNKETNLPVEQNGAPVTASKIFTASKTSGHVELEFTVDTSLFGGQSIVVFEDMYHKDIKVFTHADINDKDQTISYPDLKTTAIDTNTTDNVAVAGETTITDTVQCSNLIVGNSYTIKGTLMDKATGEYLGKDLGLEPITVSKSFKAETKNQTVDVMFTLDGSLLQGKTCVVFEDLYLENKLIVAHEKLEDVDQTVYFPSVHTTAITDAGLKEQLALNNQFIYDHVELNNLVVGKEYTVTGKVYDKDTKEAVKEGDNFITSSITFKATNARMIIGLTFDITDASKLNGKTMVVFEKLYYNDFVVATHEDINDFEQSVKYPKIETNAFDINTKLDEVPAKSGIAISDEVTYTNLEKNAIYTIKGTVYRKDTNEPLKFNDGYIIGTTTFIAKDGKAEVFARNLEYVQTLEELDTALASAAKSTTDLGKTESEEVVSGKIDVVFDNINTEVLRGKTMVAFEYLYRDDVLIGIHADINDKNQDIKVIDINTFAREKTSGIQEIICSEETNIVDTITISNVVENTTYAITSKIVDIETDEVIAEFKNNHTITAADYVETKDGYKVYNVDIDMTIDSTELGGKSFVIYEYVERDGVLLALHEDKDDLAQRLYFPYIRTTAADSETKEFDSLAEKDDVLIDTVAYENLTKGELYYVVGTLMDKSTKAPVKINGKEITSKVYFIAGEDKPLDEVPTKTRTDYVNSGEKVNGTIDVTFKFDSTSLAGKDVVVFEKAYTFDNIIIGRHEDINDKGQTISYPKVSTTLIDKSTEQHEGTARSSAVFIDTVKCTNLRIGQEYTVTGTLMDSETGKPLELKGATSSTTFTATEANCEVEVKFTLDTTSLGGKTIVCFEELYRNEHKVAVHSDITDKDQSVKIIPPPNDSAAKYVKVKIAKIDKTKPDKMLAGAEITIFNADGTVAKDINGKECVGVTDKDGLVWFHLYQNPWDHYYAQETKAPKDYALCGDKFPIYATDDMTKDADNAYQININIYDLPNRTQTGDTNNVLPFALGGLALLTLAGTSTFFIARKKKEEDDASEE